MRMLSWGNLHFETTHYLLGKFQMHSLCVMCTAPATALNPCSPEFVFIFKSQSLCIQMQKNPKSVKKV